MKIYSDENTHYKNFYVKEVFIISTYPYETTHRF